MTKTITEADARIVTGRGKLYYLKTPFYDFRGIKLVAEPVLPVLSGGKLVGHGNVYVDGSGDLSVNVFFGYDTPERLSAEAGQSIYVEAQTAFGAERSDGSELVEPSLSMGILDTLAAGKALEFNRLYVQSLELTTVQSAAQQPLKLEFPS
jgi:hypothetical protein